MIQTFSLAVEDDRYKKKGIGTEVNAPLMLKQDNLHCNLLGAFRAWHALHILLNPKTWNVEDGEGLICKNSTA